MLLDGILQYSFQHDESVTIQASGDDSTQVFQRCSQKQGVLVWPRAHICVYPPAPACQGPSSCGGYGSNHRILQPF